MNTYKGKSPKTTWWSADFKVATGQAIVTSRVINLILASGGNGSTYPPGGLRQLGKWAVAVMRLWHSILLKRAQQIYLVCSRSRGGFLRDIPAYFPLLIGRNVIVHVHGSDILDLCSRPKLGRLARLVLSRCTIILPSAHLIAPLRDFGIQNVSCCENFYDMPSKTRSAKVGPVKGSDAALKVFWNSNVMASKGFFRVSAGVQSLFKLGHNIELVAVGSCIGDEIMSYESCAAGVEALADQPWFHHLGVVDQTQAAHLLNEVDIVCLPSTYRSECQPLALIEAMCNARRIVIANTPALLATVGSYPCVAIDIPVREDAIASAILACKDISDSDLSDASKKARDRFSSARFDQEIVALLGLSQESREKVE